MTRRTGITTQAIFRTAKQYANLENFIAQGSRRAVQRSVKAAQDTKARAAIAHYNLSGTPYRGVNAIKRRFRTALGARGSNGLTQAIERLVAPAGIPLRLYGARKVKGGVRFSIVRGKPHTLRSAFSHAGFAGGHIFRRDRGTDGRLVGRLPISKRFGPGLPYLIQNREIAFQGRQTFQRRLKDELQKEETRAWKRAGL